MSIFNSQFIILYMSLLSSIFFFQVIIKKLKRAEKTRKDIQFENNLNLVSSICTKDINEKINFYTTIMIILAIFALIIVSAILWKLTES